MTPGKISKTEWSRIEEIAADIVNAVTQADARLEASLKKSILTELDNLQRKYGETASVLATKADYLDDPHASVRLLERAYVLAREAEDAQNKMLIAVTLAENYWERLRDGDNANAWLEIMDDCLLDCPDNYWASVRDSLRDQVKSATP